MEKDKGIVNYELDEMQNDKIEEFVSLYYSKYKLNKKQLAKYYALKNSLSNSELDKIDKIISSETENYSVNSLIFDFPIENYNELEYSHKFFKLKISEKQAFKLLIDKLHDRDYYAPFIDLFKKPKTEMFYLGFGDYSIEISKEKSETAFGKTDQQNTVTHYWEHKKNNTNSSIKLMNSVYSPFNCDAIPSGEIYDGEPIGCKRFLNKSAFENEIETSKNTLLANYFQKKKQAENIFPTKTALEEKEENYPSCEVFANVKATVLFAPIYSFKVIYHNVAYYCYVDGSSGIVYTSGIFSPEKDASHVNYYKNVNKYNKKIKFFICAVIFVPIIFGILFILSISHGILFPKFNNWWDTSNGESIAIAIVKSVVASIPILTFAVIGPFSLLFYLDPATQFFIKPHAYFPYNTINGQIDDGSEDFFKAKPFIHGNKTILIELFICLILACVELILLLGPLSL